MTNITTFNALVRQLLIHVGEEAPELIVNSLNTLKKIKILRALSLGDKTPYQLRESTGITESTLHRVLHQLVAVGVVVSRGDVYNRGEDRRGRPASLWGLA